MKPSNSTEKPTEEDQEERIRVERAIHAIIEKSSLAKLKIILSFSKHLAD